MTRDREELRASGYLVRIAVPSGRGGAREIDAISFKGLLALAHDAGLKATSTDLVQAPTEENRWTAIVRAQVTLPAGTFTGIGDVNPDNVNPEVAQHAIRVCETRAMARALRVALGVGEVSLEELDRFQWIRDRAVGDERAAVCEQRAPSPGVRLQAPVERSLDDRAPAGADRRAPITDNRPSPARAQPTADGRQPIANPPTPERPERFRGRDARPTERRPDDDRLAMSDTQRKLLFRLAYDMVSKDRAAAFLLERLGAARFEHVRRGEASRLIDELRAEAGERQAIQDDGGRGNGAAPPGEAARG